MGPRQQITYLLLLLTLGAGTACNESKHLASGQNLYTGGKIIVKGPISSKQRKTLGADLKTLLRPEPNASFFGIRFKLWVYNLVGTPKKDKGIRHWLKFKVGEPPVLASASISIKNREILQNHLVNEGYFFDTVALVSSVKNKEWHDNFTAQVTQPYKFRNIIYPGTDTSGVDSDAGAGASSTTAAGAGAAPLPADSLSLAIGRLFKRSLLKKGSQYDLDEIKAERNRIDDRLKQKGFYYFGPDYLELDADTTVGNRQIDARLRIVPRTPAKARRIYRINEVVVFANYDIHTDTSSRKGMVEYQGYKIVDTAHMFRPIVFSRSLVFKAGDVYNRNDHNLSLNRLISLGVYKFVKARFQETDTAGPNKLNAFYYLTPMEKKSIQFQVTALTRSDNTTGGQIGVTWKNRNIFQGAELLTFSVTAGLDEQFLGKGDQVSTRTFGANLSLYVPRFIAPFHINTSSAFVPRTKIGLGYQIYDVSDEYNLTSTQTSFGYIFKNNLITEHALNVININLVNPSNISPAFQAELDTNITLARSIERQFIIGPNYSYTINTLTRPNHRLSNYYFNGTIDVSGNLIGWIAGADVAKGKVISVFSVPISQYDRFEVDFRHYLRVGQKENTFVSRIDAGLGLAYGNSTTMPFIKEFFAGGTSDIRAFRSRQLGPGTYQAPPKEGVILPDQPGDIKLEANAEFRFKMFSILRGALFVDAGNVWTRLSDTARPGSTFTNDFFKEIGVGVGAGLRFDLKIIILRTDLAFPVREPWLPPGQRWVFGNLGNISTAVLNFAIGYPF